jgi:hypothetical protein
MLLFRAFLGAPRSGIREGFPVREEPGSSWAWFYGAISGVSGVPVVFGWGLQGRIHERMIITTLSLSSSAYCCNMRLVEKYFRGNPPAHVILESLPANH